MISLMCEIEKKPHRYKQQIGDCQEQVGVGKNSLREVKMYKLLIIK